jgi:hypothetical protein
MKHPASFITAAVACLGTSSAKKLDLPNKHGLALISDLEESDIKLLTSENSPISWYYTWSAYPNQVVGDSAIFLPLIHNLDTIEEDGIWSALDSAPSSSTHLLTFNEPDEENENGGSSASPKDIAEAYLEYIVPLRDGEGQGSDRKWNISHPVVSGSPRGLEWLRDFNESCYELEPDHGCPTDFVSVHWYGNFEGLAAWLGTLHEFYNPNNSSSISLWITEMALPQEDGEANAQMLQQSMKYLDDLPYVEGYAWFGAFREEDSNDWTGDGVSIFNDDGDLTELGSEYLGGDTEEFKDDDDSDGAGNGLRPSPTGLVMGVVGAVLAAIYGYA